jgi:hypothetical protein
MLVGFLVGACIAFVVKPARCRNPRLVLLLAVFSALLAFGSRYYWDSQRFYRTELPQALAREANIPREDAERETATLLRERSAWQSLKSYMEMVAEAGVSITKASSSSSGSPPLLSGGGYYVLLVASVALAMVIAGGIGYAACGSVYCERCERWYSDQRLGYVGAEEKELALNAVRSHDWQALKALLKSMPPSGVSYLSMMLSLCDRCNEGVLKAEELIRQKDQVKTMPLLEESISSADVAAVGGASITATGQVR